MKPDTPLEEVAQHLPAEAAKMLLDHPNPVQKSTLEHVRSLIVFWEEHRYEFDPIAYEGLLMALVASTAPLYAQLFSTIDRKQDLETRLLAAETMMRAQTELIVDLMKEEETQ